MMKKRAFGIGVLMLLAGGILTPVWGAEPAVSERPILVIVDIQNFYFAGGQLPLVGPLEAARSARQLLDFFRAKKWPVVHVRHGRKPQSGETVEPSDPQYVIHELVAPLPGEPVITKRFANSFRDTTLLDTLKNLGGKKLVICGMQTQMCVEAAVRAADDLGFAVTLVHDACATRDLTFGGQTVPARTVHLAVLAALNGSYGRVLSLAETLIDLGK
jgi:nicotinamidase-related amidase